jgi:hypothetical protein
MWRGLAVFGVVMTAISVMGCHRPHVEPDVPQAIRFLADVPDDVVLCVEITGRMRFDHPNLGATRFLCGPTLGAFRDSLVHVLKAN